MTKNWKKLQLKKTKKNFWSKTTIYLSLGLHKERPSYIRSLQLSKEAIQHFKTWNFLIFFYFYGSFLPPRIRIRNPEKSILIKWDYLTKCWKIYLSTAWLLRGSRSSSFLSSNSFMCRSCTRFWKIIPCQFDHKEIFYAPTGFISGYFGMRCSA